MRIAYCTNVRLPSERAHGHQVAQVCDALAQLGHDVTIYAPFRRSIVQEDYWTYYGANRSVQLLHLGYFDPIGRAFFPEIIALWMLNFFLRRNLRKALSSMDIDLVYTRSPVLLSQVLKTGLPVVLELHSLPRWLRRSFVRSCNRCRLIVCLTFSMRDELVSWGVDVARVIVEGDAVNLERFAALPSRTEARARWGIAADVPVIGYTGQLESMGLSKGLPELLGAAALLLERGESVYFLLAGGPDSARERMENSLPAALSGRVIFTGILSRSDVPMIAAAADVLVYPAPASDHPFYRRDTSPLKIYEYMATGKPVIAADLPPVRDILDASTAILVPPGDVEALADAIESIVADPTAAEERAVAARRRVAGHSWTERMRRILDAATVVS